MSDPIFLLSIAALTFAALSVALCLLILSRLTALGGPDRAVLGQLDALDDSIGRAERLQREEFRIAREEAGNGQRALREEVASSITRLADALGQRLREAGTAQRQQLDEFARQLRQSAAETEQRGRQAQAEFGIRLSEINETNARAGEALKASMEKQLATLRQENEAKLEQMRATVDEKLQGTLEQRLGESFKLVSERLEAVHKGLGEMQNLATGVGDLKRVLTNVKSRGGWGEVQLGALLEDMLTRDQYATNVRIRPDSTEIVEFAVRLPGRSGDDVPFWLPIDAKFPHEDYDRLLAAQDAGMAEEVERAAQALERAVRLQAKTICEKYVHPPYSTDFAILYLPTEGLFAEVIRRPGLASEMQSKHRVMIQGPTTLAALLTSLQMGFRTLAIEKRSSEVWQVLGAAKSEFLKYGEVWEKLGKQLDTARRTVDEAGKRTRAVSRRLRDVEALEIGPVVPGDLLAIGAEEEETDVEERYAEAAQ